MNTNAHNGSQGELSANEPEENLAVTAFDATFSSLEFDREHGDEVESARRILDADAEMVRPAA